LIGLSIALMAVGAFITLPFGPVPFTLQTLMLVLVLLILTPAEAVAAVGGYLLLGAIGLPIFSGMRGGLGVLAGPTGGFLIGFLLGAVVAAVSRLLVAKHVSRPSALLGTDIAAALVAVVISYVTGVFFFDAVTGAGLQSALLICVLPFVIPDAIKIAAAIVCAQPIRAALGRSVFKQREKTTAE
jgi:biotin transport system substrate-specific component